MTKILLVRHGESVSNCEGTFAGHLDIELSSRGKKQAELTAQHISKNYDISAVYSSDLQRAEGTAKPIAKLFGLDVILNKDFREIYAGEWQGLSFDKLQLQYDLSYNVWLKDIGNAVCPQGETVKQLYDRIWKAIEKAERENVGKTIVIVTHATPIRAVCCRLKGYSLDRMKDVGWVTNASVSVIACDNGKWFLEQTSIDKHLSSLCTQFPPNV